MHVGEEIVRRFDAAVFDGDEGALLLFEVLHGLVDVGFGDFDLGLS